ncbi:DUF1617 family protein [Vagococcus fluvialis]|uniref:DUF1617 family protein n=1 Tax=Vagococcus fluvialis TaxID=2738 RepID=UPI0020335DD2|nr:DUF1617 family protein [Vagococcus fluvialis]MCM2138895.1 DUF1617 family protein [Vagococcus fluvialis]
MKISLKNSDLAPIVNLLNKTTAKGRAARAISRFHKIMMAKLSQFQEDEIDTFKEHCVLDENGEVIVSEGGTVTFLDGQTEAGVKAHNELKEEDNVIDLTEFKPFIEFLMNALENSESELNINEMDTLDNLLTKLEELRKEDK